MTTVYKFCLKRANGQYMSCCMNFWFEETWRARYEIDKQTLPPLEGSRLFAFKTLDVAKDWARQYQQAAGAIFECDAEVDEAFELADLPAFSCVAAFWKMLSTGMHLADVFGSCGRGAVVPHDTVFCNSITPRNIVFTQEGMHNGGFV